MSGPPPKPKWHDIKVRYVGVRKLAVRIGRAHKDVRTKSELKAYAMVVAAMADFLDENVWGEVRSLSGVRAPGGTPVAWSPVITLWLRGLVSALADLDRGIVPPMLRAAKTGNKSLPTNEWRRFAAISAGMKALTMCKVSRGDAAGQALRAVKAIRNTKKGVVLGRYDEFQKGRVKNRAAAADYSRSCKFLEGQAPDSLRKIARQLFVIADMLA